MQNHPEITAERATGTRTGLRTALALSALAVVAGEAREALAKCATSAPTAAASTPCVSTVSPALRPAPGNFSHTTGRTELVKPFDGGTFYPTEKESGRSMGPDQLNGFDLKAGEKKSFYITGEDGPGNEVTLELYPWVPTDEAKRQALGQLRAGVTMDDVSMETALQTLPAGTVLQSSKSVVASEEVALWSTPIRVSVRIPQGTHELTLQGLGSAFRAVFRGVTETHTPDIEAGIEYPFEGDRRFPPEVKFAGRVAVAPYEPSGYRLENITPNSLPVSFTLKIIPLNDDLRVRVRFEQAGTAALPAVVYESGFLEPNEDTMIRLKRVSPPTESTDHTGPDRIMLMIRTPAGNEPIVTSTPSEVTCRMIENGAKDWVSCERPNTADGSKSVYQTFVDERPTNPNGIPRRHVAHRVP